MTPYIYNKTIQKVPKIRESGRDINQQRLTTMDKPLI